MLSFSTDLVNKLSKDSTNAIFLLRLYYGNETNFTGFSTIDYTDGSDIYFGAIVSLGDYSQSLSFFGFNGRTNLLTVKIANTDFLEDKKRFSDLIGTNAYDNRKWELYVIPSDGSVSKQLIGVGVISGNFDYDHKTINIKLNDFSKGIDTTLPRTVIREDDTANDFHYAPEENFNKPIPMLFGDHSHTTDYDETSFNNSDGIERWATRSKVPAIVVNSYDTGTNKIIAKADTEALHTLNNVTVYFGKDGVYSALNPSNVTVSASDAKISFSGTRAYAMMGLIMDSATNSSYTKDKFVETTLEKNANVGNQELFVFGVPKVPNLGTMITNPVKAFVIGKNVSGSDSVDINYKVDDTEVSSQDQAVGNGTRVLLGGIGSDGVDISGGYTATQESGWDLESKLQMFVELTGGDADINVDQAWIQIEYDADDTVNKTVYTEEVFFREDPYYSGDKGNFETQKIARRVDVFDQVQTIYISGKGRKFTAAMTSSRSHSFTTSDLIEHPVFVIENILRTELGLTDTNINTSNFDSIYSATTTYKAAFSQYEFISAMDLIDDICKQFCLYFFFDSQGKATIKNLKLKASYTSADFTIDFNEVQLSNISKTPLNQVKTNIRVEFDHDYSTSKNRLNVQTSSSTKADFNMNNETNMIVDANKIRFNVEGTSLANAKSIPSTILDLYEDIHQERKNIINLNTLKPEYLKAEIGDIVQISNVPSDIKLFGTAISSQFFMITKVSRKINQVSMELTQVS